MIDKIIWYEYSSYLHLFHFFNYGFTAQAFKYVFMVFYFMGLIVITRLVYWFAKDIFDDIISFFKDISPGSEVLIPQEDREFLSILETTSQR